MAEITPFVNRFNRDVAPATPVEYLGSNRNRANTVAQRWRRLLWGRTVNTPDDDYQAHGRYRSGIFAGSWLGRRFGRKKRARSNAIEARSTAELQQYMAMAQFAINLALLRDAQGSSSVATYQRQLNNLNNRWHSVYL